MHAARLELFGVTGHNLRGIDVAFELGRLNVVSGVSGAGKSTLLFDVLRPSLEAGRAVGCESVHGFGDAFDQLLAVDQLPLGTGASSTPATVSGVLDLLGAPFAATPEAKARRFAKARFAYGGRSGGCKVCGGVGRERIEMGFLPPVWTECAACGGTRYEPDTLQVKVRGHSIAEVLGLTFAEAAALFEGINPLGRKLALLSDVGLGYLRLGQPASSLSGGEAQRLRLGTELLRSRPGRRTLYLLDEPTTGLHATEVAGLLALLSKLVERGHTVVVIEHDLQVMAAADWLIALGPEGGDGGGRIVDEGTPEEIVVRGLGHTGRALGAAP